MTEELKQAAQQALEALEHAVKDVADFQRLNTDQTSIAIKSLRRALTAAQPAQAAKPDLSGRDAFDVLSGSDQARASLPTQPAQAAQVPEWAECERISNSPEVDEALRLFAEGEATSDQAVCIVQAVLTAAQQGAEQAKGDDDAG